MAASPSTPALALVEDALSAYRALAELGEQVEDEWQYVNDLLEAWSADLLAVAAADERPVDVATHTAIDLLVEEVGLIADPHRAIDWLSTFPQVVRFALESRP